MTAWRSTRTLLPVIFLMGLVSLLALPSPSTLAQGPPTPTNVAVPTGERPGRRGGEEGPTPAPPGADVSGFVYDYSTHVRQPGITVVIDGGGWQAETVSNSNGFYQFSNLGAGVGVLNLRLPPGAHAVAPNWPVSFGIGANVSVNLGYYWGDANPLPVLASAGLENSVLKVRVENRTGEIASGGLVDIVLPDGIQAAANVQASQGTVDYSEGRVRARLQDIPGGAQATIQVMLEKVGTEARSARGPGQAAPLAEPPPSSNIQVMFTYDQQITPQLLIVEPQTVSPASGETLMPVTGSGLSASGLVSRILPILLIVGLLAAGWRALRVPHDGPRAHHG
jgi:hypothetical protein